MGATGLNVLLLLSGGAGNVGLANKPCAGIADPYCSQVRGKIECSALFLLELPAQSVSFHILNDSPSFSPAHIKHIAVFCTRNHRI